MNERVSTEKYVITDHQDTHELHLIVDGMHCPSCVAVIENTLLKEPEVIEARLNLSTRRLRVLWRGDKAKGDAFVSLINAKGYNAAPFDPVTSESYEQREEKFLLRCLAVAGFASGNMMLFSVPIWSADTAQMGDATRTMFYWIQALIAVPVLAYSGLPFYRSALNALKARTTNMDVPISVAVILATLMSLYEVITHGRHAYFDSGVMLLFFLLIGRYLDLRARGKARSAAQDLLQMMKGNAALILEDGSHKTIPVDEITEGMTLLVSAGEKIGADGVIIKGKSDIDTSLMTGETIPQTVVERDTVFGGTLNIGSPLHIQVTKAGERSLLAEIIKCMETAEQGQARYVTLADKISGWYTPAVHALALLTFLGWLFYGAFWQDALLIASTVLIITCPCALGLAVPVVQVLASGKLMKQGILLKSGDALERLAAFNYAVFDKTGTLTEGKPKLQNSQDYPIASLRLAASMAAHSNHPLSKALSAAYQGQLEILPEVQEISGHGLQSFFNGKKVQLGKQDWCVPNAPAATDNALELWLAVEEKEPIRFIFADILREDATDIISYLNQAGIHCTLLSGDREAVVQQISAELGIQDFKAALTPSQKVNYIEQLKQQYHVLMVGDGLNDAPALVAAHVSMSPSSALDMTQNAADIVFQGKKLAPVLIAWRTAKFSVQLVKENFWLAILYNVIAIPLAIAGYVTPLIAAIAMSSSSLIVIANSMRLNRKGAL